jgi:hypothetical protein
MNYELELQAKREELAKLEKEVEKKRIAAATLKVGQCYKNKQNNYTSKGYSCYQKLLYVDDSKFGYTLVIDERITFEPLRLFQQGKDWPNDNNNVNIPDQDVMLTIGQAYNFESDLALLEPITEEEFAKAKAKALDLLINSHVPKNWAEAVIQFQSSKEQKEIEK